jgi:23S rRNA (cytidine1920-2'-O)/16S rRNA (cytidine1409-2'-O)-methyltransferase
VNAKKLRLDAYVARSAGITRSQAETTIKLGEVSVNGRVTSKPGYFVREDDAIVIKTKERYVSRAGLKLASVASEFGLYFRDKVVLDIGSSTGGFTDYALQHGARKVIAIDVGTEQLHPSLRGDSRIDLREKTDFRDVRTLDTPDVAVIDVSFISIREILAHLRQFMGTTTQVAAMVKPQFEAINSDIKHKGVIKNDKFRREILKDFEAWVKQYYFVANKADSKVPGEKGNVERFYLLQKQK